MLNLEGIFTRYEDADEQLERIAALPKELATREMQEIYIEPVKEELIAQRIREIKAEGVVCAASLTPQRVRRYYEIALDAGLDMLVIQGTVVSGEHVSTTSEPLNLKEFIPELDVPVIVGGCASYHTGLHLMRTGAAGVLVGVGPGAACTTRGVLGIGVPQATAIADVAGARADAHARDRRVRPGDRRRRHAHRRRRRQGDRLRRRRRDDRLAAGARLRGARPRLPLGHGDVPSRRCRAARACRRSRTRRSRRSSLGPAHENDGTLNLFGGLRTSMATCGYKDIAEFNRAELMIAPGAADRGQAAPARPGRRHGLARRSGRARRPSNGPASSTPDA